jgi:hypothetical protein
MTASAPGNRPVKPVRTLVYLARHSQTPLNESDVLRGLTDPPLDDAGQRRASQLGATLGSPKPSVVVPSPLRRALQTAQPVADRDQRAVPGLTDAAERYRGCAVSHDAVTRQVLMASTWAWMILTRFPRTTNASTRWSSARADGRSVDPAHRR